MYGYRFMSGFVQKTSIFVHKRIFVLILVYYSIVNYVATQMVMTRVMELLADKNLSILEVSEKAGFTNQRYFSTVFKQANGMTPSKYRQEHFS